MSITLDGSNAGTVGVLNSGTAVATTSGTFVDYTGIPAGVKRITVIFINVSLSGTAHILVQVGTGSTPLTSTYSASSGVAYGTNLTNSTGVLSNGMPIYAGNAANAHSGVMTLNLAGSNFWVASGAGSLSSGGVSSGGFVQLGGALGMVRITTSNGTDTFDSGSVNIFWE